MNIEDFRDPVTTTHDVLKGNAEIHQAKVTVLIQHDIPIPITKKTLEKEAHGSMHRSTTLTRVSNL